MPQPTELDPATSWAESVVNGDIVSGGLVRLACERHLRDRVDGPKRGIHWKPELATHALGFFPAVLTVTAGAKVGEPFCLPSYTAFVVGSLFGWRRANKLLRYRHAWLELGKGQIKSPLMAALGIYMMGWYGVARSECYAIAKDRNQANVLFQDAVQMCQTAIPDSDGETLESRGDVVIRGTGEMAWMIEHPATASKFRALAGDERVSGPRPTMVLGDEIHEWKTGTPIETWQAALAKMPGDAMMILGTNTPAADQAIGTEYSEIYQQILRGEAEDDTAFAIIARTDPTDEPMKDESCWAKSLPCLGLTFPIDNVRNEVVAAKHRMAKSLTVQRLYFGIPVGTSEYWIDLDAWTAVQGKVDVAAMTGKPCWLGMDLSQKNDLTALAICWKDDDGKLYVTVRYWKPKARLADAQREDHANYVQWAAEGLLNTTPGKAIEYDFVAKTVRDITESQAVEFMAFDPAHISEFRKACDRIEFPTWIWTPEEDTGSGLKMIIHGQGKLGMMSSKALWMPRSLKKLEDAILTGAIVIDESPVTKWCSGNAAVTEDAQGNSWLDKKRSRGRIDGLVAMAMSVGSAMLGEGDGTIYADGRDLVVV